jgi:Putative bacterial sensory transduction regulator
VSSSPSDLPAPPEVPRPVTFERLAALLAPDGYTVDADNRVLRRRWPHAEIVVSLPPGDSAVLLVGATRSGPPFPHARQLDLEEFVNDWHRDRIWPTLVLGASDAGLTLYARIGVDTAAGLTDAQLREYLRVGVGTTKQCFGALDVPQQ